MSTDREMKADMTLHDEATALNPSQSQKLKQRTISYLWNILLNLSFRYHKNASLPNSSGVHSLEIRRILILLVVNYARLAKPRAHRRAFGMSCLLASAVAEACLTAG
jgi:hypothetical protein